MREGECIFREVIDELHADGGGRVPQSMLEDATAKRHETWVVVVLRGRTVALRREWVGQEQKRSFCDDFSGEVERWIWLCSSGERAMERQ